MAHPIGDGRFSVCIAQHKASPWKKRKKILCLKETGDSGKAFLGWYTASSRYRARSAKGREAIGRATANKTLWRQKSNVQEIISEHEHETTKI
jgi:hypothetical protein